MLKLNVYYTAKAKHAPFQWLDADWVDGRTDEIINYREISENCSSKYLMNFTDLLFKVVMKRGNAVMLYFPELDKTMSHHLDLMSNILEIKEYKKNVNTLWNELNDSN